MSTYVLRRFTTSKNSEKGKKKTYDEVVDAGVLKVFTHSTLEGGDRTKFTTNIIIFFLS